MIAYRIGRLPEQGRIETAPDVQRWPGALPHGVTNDKRLPDCETCIYLAECHKRQVANYHDRRHFRPFVDPTCEMASREAPEPKHYVNHSETVRRNNAKRVFEMLQELQPCSAIDIAHAAGLRPETVRAHLVRLIAEGYARKTETVKARGMPPTTIYAMIET